VPIVGGKEVPTRVLSSQLSIRPLAAFETSVSDERVYADMSDPGFVWVGRHDNAMGPGKGSSIRHLLPEEAIKMARLLVQEPGQHIGTPSPYQLMLGSPLAHENGLPIDELPTDHGGAVEREDELYYLITRQLFTKNSPLRTSLVSHLPPGITWNHIEYASSAFPCSATRKAARS